MTAPPRHGNLFAGIPDTFREELATRVPTGAGVRIERVVSRGHVSPDDFWYDQDEHEWVAVLSGAARLRFDDGRDVVLGPGDYIDIPAHTRHRVHWTAPDEDTVWLAVFYAEDGLQRG